MSTDEQEIGGKKTFKIILQDNRKKIQKLTDFFENNQPINQPTNHKYYDPASEAKSLVATLWKHLKSHINMIHFPHLTGKQDFISAFGSHNNSYRVIFL